jgi:hypothetical protein
MKRLLFLSILFLVTSLVASAGSYDLYCLINGAVAGCNATNGSGQLFTASGTLGSATFSDFSISAIANPPLTGAPPVPLGSTGQVVLNTPASTLYPGFYTSGSNLTSTAYAGTSSSYQITLGYLVSNTSPWAADVEGSFSAGCTSLGGATGACGVTVTENVWTYSGNPSAPIAGQTELGTFTLSGTPAIGTVISVPATGLGGVGFNPPTSSIYIQKIITLDAIDTTGSGSNSITAGITTFDQVITPEPGFYGLLACGISALFFLKRKGHQS